MRGGLLTSAGWERRPVSPPADGTSPRDTWGSRGSSLAALNWGESKWLLKGAGSALLGQGDGASPRGGQATVHSLSLCLPPRKSRAAQLD